LLNEEEFSKANIERRDERTSTEMRVAELREEVHSTESSQNSIATVPGRGTSFIESFEQLETPKAKAMLHLILKAVYVWTDGKVELKFR
jgi:DNA-binding winged helix-turn-helix (wHTH) protein